MPLSSGKKPPIRRVPQRREPVIINHYEPNLEAQIAALRLWLALPAPSNAPTGKAAAS